ncbi:MAG: ABC transporter ATP-binding protein [Bacillota bacterium]|nr:ABC transporter ATP-binding protein [Bacillota bacterium]
MSIKVENLRYSFPRAKRPIIHDISFEVPDGSVSSVIGANGVGKSTLLKTMIGIYKGEGEVWFNNRRRQDLSHEALYRQIGYMTQENARLSSLSVLDVVLLGRLGTLNIRVQESDIAKALSIIRLLHLEPFIERPYYALSGGQRRIVDVAQTLARDPQVLIMDEPTANLDLVNELQVLELVRAYTRQKNTTTLLTLHDLNLAARYSDHLILLKDGQVFSEGAPEQVITEAAIREAYGVEVHVHISSRTNTPMVLPLKAVHKTEYVFPET